MIIVMKARAKHEELQEVVMKIEKMGYKPHVIHGVERNVIGAVGDERGKTKLQSLEVLSGVEKVVPILKPYKLASRDIKPEGTVVKVNGKVEIGGERITVIAGPCAVECEEQIIESACIVKEAGADILRGGAFKPRTSPYSFQGLEEEGLILLAKAREKTGLPVITEIMNPKDVDLVEKYSDIMQVGARNVQNFSLLKKLGRCNKPILLKRGMSTTIEEFLMSAEYILSEGNKDVILCERGIRTFETATRCTLDLSCVPVLKERTHLPIIVDPSHSTGYWSYVAPMSYAAIAAGADGLMVEVHPKPEEAESDGKQSLKPHKFASMMQNLRAYIDAAGRM
ncbi:MAG: 3-deoxy-7-phosphoheptulonate synthase [Thermodesulfobacteriota bacterium]|nr:3-deoxy-7-phosphoheptulonate synthase [Thermodesulfobacteriota bacterium]